MCDEWMMKGDDKIIDGQPTRSICAYYSTRTTRFEVGHLLI